MVLKHAKQFLTFYCQLSRKTTSMYIIIYYLLSRINMVQCRWIISYLIILNRQDMITRYMDNVGEPFNPRTSWTSQNCKYNNVVFVRVRRRRLGAYLVRQWTVVITQLSTCPSIAPELTTRHSIGQIAMTFCGARFSKLIHRLRSLYRSQT